MFDVEIVVREEVPDFPFFALHASPTIGYSSSVFLIIDKKRKGVWRGVCINPGHWFGPGTEPLPAPVSWKVGQRDNNLDASLLTIPSSLSFRNSPS